MSEQLVSLHKKGGGNETPVWELGNPDVSDALTVSAGNTGSVAVTQMPRFIMLYRVVSNNTNDTGYILNYDLDTGNCRYIGYNGNFATGTGASSFFANVTSSVVQVKGPSSGTAVYRFAIAIWY